MKSMAILSAAFLASATGAAAQNAKVGPANHAGKRAILVGGGVGRGAFALED
jgi:hypothetical protein